MIWNVERWGVANIYSYLILFVYVFRVIVRRGCKFWEGDGSQQGTVSTAQELRLFVLCSCATLRIGTAATCGVATVFCSSVLLLFSRCDFKGRKVTKQSVFVIPPWNVGWMRDKSKHTWNGLELTRIGRDWGINLILVCVRVLWFSHTIVICTCLITLCIGIAASKVGSAFCNPLVAQRIRVFQGDFDICALVVWYLSCLADSVSGRVGLRKVQRERVKRCSWCNKEIQ